MPGVFFAPFPYSYRYGWSDEETRDWCLEELRFLLQTQTAPEETASILIEPVLGEGGYVVPPKGFLEGIRDICNEHEILLIVDEIQSGIGRTGKWFAFEYSNVLPDIIVTAKGLASGLPLSGIIASMELMSMWPSGSHGGTYGGNAVACAAAAETIRVLKEEELLGNALEKGEKIRAGLRRLKKSYPEIGDVRGLGLMNAIEFSTLDGKPDPEFSHSVMEEALQERLLLLGCGSNDNVIRIIPPLNTSESEIKRGLKILEDAVGNVKKKLS
jgi:4-aminobutyrate aminotransferase